MDTPAPPTTIKIAEDLVVPVRSERSVASPPDQTPITRVDTGYPGGIYNTRTIDRRYSLDPRGASIYSNAETEDADGWMRDGLRTKQVFGGRTMLWLAYQSIGVIYGDIGTSPLYVFSSTFTSPPSTDNLVQVLSIIIWSITLVVTVKYVLTILCADNEGEGGTFSCYSLLTRYANITDRDPREQGLVRIERHLTSELKPSTKKLRFTLERSTFFRGLLKTIGVLAVSMVMSDGVLTPAQSILGAVQGLQVVKPDISQPTVVGTTCGILVLLFLIQPLGTTKLAAGFAPIVILWLGFNGGFGVYNLVRFDWAVLKAFSPYFAFQFFVEHRTEGWKMLGGVLLAFTGVEALFADLGAFSLRAIRLSWLAYTYPCLLLAYIGQAAYISVHPEAYSNPFFNSVPPGMLYPSLVVAVLAAIVASQAIITATFQLISQIMKLSYCPQVKVVHTSRVFHGQVYVPFLNWVLMLGAILVTAVYRDTTRLGNAYGVCVMFVTFFDTCMVTLVALIVWRLSPFVVFLPWLCFAAIDGLYLSSALIKVPDGAWLTLLVSAVLTALFLLWRFGKENQWRAEAEDRFKPSTLVTTDEPAGVAAADDATTPVSGSDSSRPRQPTGTGSGIGLRLTDKWGGDSLSTLRGFGVFFDKAGSMTPTVFTQFVTKFVAVPDVTVFFHLHPVEAPTVPDAERYIVARFREIPGCYRLIVRHGFMDEVISPDLAALIYEQVRSHVATGHVALSAGEGATTTGAEVEEPDKSGVEKTTEQGVELDRGHNVHVHQVDAPNPALRLRRVSLAVPPELRNSKVAAELARLDRAYAAKVMYVVGKEQMRVRAGSSWWRKGVLSTFLWIRENTRAKIANLRLAMERVVEVGFVKDI